MTKEEAIKIINCYDIGFYDLSGEKIPADKLAEAFDMAIEALKERPKGEWIPCSERLPEELSVVNVTYVNHDPEPYYDFVKDIAFTETAVYYRGDWYWNWSGCVDVLAEYGRDDANKVDKAVEVIAWMPLPAPYGGESNG